MSLNMLNFTPAGGEHTRTRLGESGLIELGPKVMFSPNPEDWTVDGAAPTFTNGVVTINNTDRSNRFLSVIVPVHQTTPATITFRVKATGSGIETNPATGFSIYAIATFTSGGLGDNSIPSVDAQTNFPSGTWPEGQYSLTITPDKPVTWLYVYLFARNKKGTLTAWDLEIFQDGDEASKVGYWVSEPLDLAMPVPIPVNSPTMDHIIFYYGEPDNVNSLADVAESKEVLSGFDSVVIREPGEFTGHDAEVIQYLISKGVKVYGYTYLGGDANIPTNSAANINGTVDRCAAAGYYGVFWDMAGFDWGVTRSTFNLFTTYAHSKGLKVMANAWFPSDVLDPAPVTLFNPGGVPTALTEGDWVLLESFYSRGDDTLASPNDMQKYQNTVTLAKPLGVKVAALAYAAAADPLASNHNRDASYMLASMLKLDGWSYGDTHGDNLVFWKDMPQIYTGSNPLVEVGEYHYEVSDGRYVYWYKAKDNERFFGAKKFLARSINAEPALALATAERVTYEVEMASSRFGPWTPLTGFPMRFVRVRIRLENDI